MSLNLRNIQKEMKLLFLVQQPEGYDSKDFLSAELLLIFDQEPENVAASTSKANTIESLPANKKSDCVYPLKTISTRLNLHASAGLWSENYAGDSLEGIVDNFYYNHSANHSPRSVDELTIIGVCIAYVHEGL